MQEDTYRGDGLNLYAYCANNPVIYHDPSGKSATCDHATDAEENVQQENITSEGGNKTSALLKINFLMSRCQWMENN